MNKQEAIEKLEGISWEYEDRHFKITDAVELDDAIDIINQIDDCPKVKIPRFVADWYERNKGDLEYNLYLYQISIYEEKVKEDNFFYWTQTSENPVHTLINMHQFGYEVEQEKKYKVKIANNGSQPLTFKKIRAKNLLC
ncbi:DUF1642 domain-containing protein [Streptococcus respiraculi]|uniref:DUF1642 domain-containing protein n=1 Tax=Streptococcus respiraculi TaxID=2021971 RepID=UPI000E723B9F|nr:DUF1642 domain-containing protein [Streptococcus respiraculi]